MTAEMLLRTILFVIPAIFGYYVINKSFLFIFKRIVACINDYWYQTFNQSSVLTDDDAAHMANAITICIYMSIYLFCVFLMFFNI